MNYKTAWSIKHKLMRTKRERDYDKRLSGRIEMDFAYLGGKHAGIPGRGSPNKVPFIAVVETTEDKRPQRIHLRTVSGFRRYAIANYARENLAPGSTVWSDGLACFSAVKLAQCVGTDDGLAIVGKTRTTDALLTQRKLARYVI